MIPGDDEDAGRSFPLKKSGSDRIKDLSVLFFFSVRIDYVDCKNKISCIYTHTHGTLGTCLGEGREKVFNTRYLLWCQRPSLS